MQDDSKARMPEMYEIYYYKLVKNIGRIFSAGWWLFLAYMTITSRKDGAPAYILSYGLLVLGLMAVIYVFSRGEEKFIVQKGVITQYFAFSAPKTYYIEDITKVVVRKPRGGIEYRIYIEEKRIFELDTMMWNYNLFIETLQKKGIPFQ